MIQNSYEYTSNTEPKHSPQITMSFHELKCIGYILGRGVWGDLVGLISWDSRVRRDKSRLYGGGVSVWVRSILKKPENNGELLLYCFPAFDRPGNLFTVSTRVAPLFVGPCLPVLADNNLALNEPY